MQKKSLERAQQGGRYLKTKRDLRRTLVQFANVTKEVQGELRSKEVTVLQTGVLIADGRAD